VLWLVASPWRRSLAPRYSEEGDAMHGTGS
jgi:hypothetical protein